MTEAIDNVSPYLSAYNVSNVNPASVEQLASGQAVKETSDAKSGVALSDQIFSYGSSLTQNIANSSNGIAVAQIAQAGLENQQGILAEIEKLTRQAIDTTNQTEKEFLQQEIVKQLDQYDEVAKATTLNNETILKTSGDNTDDISVVNNDDIIEMSKADTTSISDSLRFFLNEFDTNEDAMGNMLKNLQESEKQLASFSKDFKDAAEQLQISVQNAIATEASNVSQQTTLEIDYSKEVTDFNKTNLLAQMGYIMQVQPNAQQQKTISLLS